MNYTQHKKDVCIYAIPTQKTVSSSKISSRHADVSKRNSISTSHLVPLPPHRRNDDCKKYPRPALRYSDLTARPHPRPGRSPCRSRHLHNNARSLLARSPHRIPQPSQPSIAHAAPSSYHSGRGRLPRRVPARHREIFSRAAEALRPRNQVPGFRARAGGRLRSRLRLGLRLGCRVCCAGARGRSRHGRAWGCGRC